MAAVVIGGGVAGVCCAQELRRLESPYSVVLISASPMLAEAQTIMKQSQYLQEVTVYERTAEQMQSQLQGIDVIIDTVVAVNNRKKALALLSGRELVYHKLCLCTGVRPKPLAPFSHPFILSLRDYDSVEALKQQIKDGMETILLIGNGGIALEVVYELTFCNIIWVLKDAYIGNTFFDATASAFIWPVLRQRRQAHRHEKEEERSKKRHREEGKDSLLPGAGQECQLRGKVWNDFVATDEDVKSPEWAKKTRLHEISSEDNAMEEGDLQIHLEQEVIAIWSQSQRTWQFVSHDHGEENHGCQYPLPSVAQQNARIAVLTSSHQIFAADLLLAAIGVEANVDFAMIPEHLQRDDQGFVVVNDEMRTSDESIYAAGDCCAYCPSSTKDTNHFFQMRLWTQARLMGMYAAQCMLQQQQNYGLDAGFELFAHITRFFGYKVVLLGRFNAQGLGVDREEVVKQLVVTTAPASNDETLISTATAASSALVTAADADDAGPATARVQVWLRVTATQEYVKLVIYDNKLVGALLIGDTEMEETMENLILNQLDVSQYGIDLLRNDIDVADYFD